MYKNQLQELAQRSCFNLPSYSCIREGPDHAPRFKATVNFNGETFESPTFCSTLRQAEHAAAEVALNTLASRGPSKALAARVLDETGVYKNLLQETAHRAGLKLPVYTTIRSGPGHVPVFLCTVELAGKSFSGEPAKTKKQAQKNAAMAAWTTLKQLAQQRSSSSTSTSTSTSHSSPPSDAEGSEEQEQVVIARFLSSLKSTESNNSTHNGGQRSMLANSDPTSEAQGLYPVQYDSWPYSSFPAEIGLYQMWQQAHLLQLQGHHLLALPVPPAPRPPVLRMQSIFEPDHHLYFSSREHRPIPVGPGVAAVDALSPSLRDREPVPAGPGVTSATPSFYMQSNLSSSSIRGRSMVNIQEIKEGKTEELSNIHMAEVCNPAFHGDSKTEKIVHEAIQEEKKNNGGLEPKAGGSDQQECKTTRQFEGLPLSKNLGFHFVELPAQSHRTFDSYYRSHLRPHLQRARPQTIISTPAAVAAAPMMTTVGCADSPGSRCQTLGNQMPALPRMRTGATSNSTRPIKDFGRVPYRFMAPAVQIRSVAPVCSAPPVGMSPDVGQVEQSSNQEVKSSKQEEDVSAASSQLSKLQM
ncbi:double-stranded RNA-binding protein 2-like [Diospyros lotus]|uniref:double-stranded RNA-binding protein 2-like n=1 Tax=Diospyros lotus TaxID=55363 RepID=UPI00225BECB7|nr:double-stranded RNA-binding protein 2-like [Diospyros lotus]XP_052194490.1 double-stranded RNA-binding protein 2-like [Diospyros lotus]